jgi:hypothetical protein
MYEELLISTDNKNILKVNVHSLYHDLFQSHASQLGHYFRHLYHIVKFVDESSEPNKKKYVDIIQSQLTDEQLLTFFVLLLMDKEKNNERVLGISLMKLMDKYHFFKNLYFPTNKESLGKFLCTNFPETKNSFHWFKENIVDNEQR